MNETAHRDLAAFALTAVVAIALVLAQYAVPAWAGFHEWPYATLLGVAALLLVTQLWDAMRARLPVAHLVVPAGALCVVVAGVASGLLGPDTQTVSAGPATVVPLPDVGAAVAFPIVDARSLEAGSGVLQLRTRGAVENLVAGSRRLSGSFVLEAETIPAAFITAADLAGRHMTITQPGGAGFLSPVLLFSQRVTIAGKSLQADAFAVPALNRQIKAVLFPPGSLGDAKVHGSIGGKDAILFVAAGSDGRLDSGGIGLAPSGGSITLGDVVLHPTLGRYPQLVVSAVPSPWPVAIGILAVFGGTALGAGAGRKKAEGRAPAPTNLASPSS